MQNFRFSVITPNEKVYDMVQLMIQDSTRVAPGQVTLINGSQKDAASQIADAVHSGAEALLAWEPMARQIVAAYPQARVYVIQPSILDLLNCIHHAPKEGKLGGIIPFSLRDYYDDLKPSFRDFQVAFYHVAPEYDDQAMREIIRQAAARGITALIGTDALSSMIAAQDIDWIPLRRFGATHEIASLVVWLCSEGANYTTGQSLIVDGGFMLANPQFNPE